jgi:hypothetical protein
MFAAMTEYIPGKSSEFTRHEGSVMYSEKYSFESLPYAKDFALTILLLYFT